MKIKIVMVVMCVLVSNLIWGFEFLGIKSGMTTDEVKLIFPYDQLKDDYKKDFNRRYAVGITDYEFKSKNVFTEYPAVFIDFDFTDNILWKIQLRFFKTTSLIGTQGFKNAIAKLYPSSEIQSYTDKSVNMDFWIVTIIDEELLNNAITRSEEKWLGKLK